MDVVVSTKEMEEAGRGNPPRGGISAKSMRATFDAVFPVHLERANIKLSPAERQTVSSSIDQVMQRVAQPPELPINITDAVDGFVTSVTRVLSAHGSGDVPIRIPDPRDRPGPPADKAEENLIDMASGGANIEPGANLSLVPPEGPIEPARIERFATDFRSALRLEAIQRRTAPPRLRVLVTNAARRVAGPMDLLSRIRLSISEEGFEWTAIDSEDKTISRLVPE
jgi:hypothetical protein